MEARLVGYQGPFALIEISNETIKLPIKLIPETAQVGENIFLKITSLNDDHKDKLVRMRTMLQELIN